MVSGQFHTLVMFCIYVVEYIFLCDLYSSQRHKGQNNVVYFITSWSVPTSLGWTRFFPWPTSKPGSPSVLKREDVPSQVLDKSSLLILVWWLLYEHLFLGQVKPSQVARPLVKWVGGEADWSEAPPGEKGEGKAIPSTSFQACTLTTCFFLFAICLLLKMKSTSHADFSSETSEIWNPEYFGHFRWFRLFGFNRFVIVCPLTAVCDECWLDLWKNEESFFLKGKLGKYFYRLKVFIWP